MGRRFFRVMKNDIPCENKTLSQGDELVLISIGKHGLLLGHMKTGIGYIVNSVWIHRGSLMNIENEERLEQLQQEFISASWRYNLNKG